MLVFSSRQFAWTYVTPSGVATRGHVLTPPQIMIIGLMHLSNPMVYTQFHPVAYMAKLNIEMTMASLIKKIAQATVSKREGRSMGRYTYEYAGNEITHPASAYQNGIHTTASARPRMPSNAQTIMTLTLTLTSIAYGPRKKSRFGLRMSHQEMMTKVAMLRMVTLIDSIGDLMSVEE